jgi:hypothetical protein
MLHRIFVIVLLSAVIGLAGTVDPPLRVNIKKLDRTELSGQITRFDENGFELMDYHKQMSTLTWDEFAPGTIMMLHARLIQKGTPDQWFELGKKLLTMPGGRESANTAFGKALRLDKSFKDKIEAARKEAKVVDPSTRAARTGLDRDSTIGERSRGEDGGAGATTRSSVGPRDPSKPIVGPQMVGPVDASQWGKQTPEQEAAALKGLKGFGEQTRQTMQLPISPFETKYFLFYSDLRPQEAVKWANMLDAMYTRLATLFAVPAGENLWRGKALIFVFSKEQDYLNFELKMHHTIAAGTAGMCHAFGNGDVHIAFYRQPADLDFAHVLVHESVHGFLHRYRSPVNVPSWANEGLAEAIASDMIVQKGVAQSSYSEARADLQQRKSLGKFFDAPHIVAWQYPVARTLCEFMIRSNKPGYVDFINGIKDGLDSEQALKDKYGVTVEQLVNAYGQSMGVAGLQP